MAPSQRLRRLVRNSVSATLFLTVVGLVTSWVAAERLVAPQPRVIGDPPTYLPGMSIVLASDSGSNVAGWHIPSDPSNGVVVLLHPIRGSRLSMLERARMLHAEGYSIVMIDLQAHGESPGKRITVGYLEKYDVRAAVGFARQLHPNEPIGVVGVSLGGASALLASPLGIDAAVLESVYPTFTGAVHNRVAMRLGPLSFVPAELLLLQLRPQLGISDTQLRPIDHIPNGGCAVLIMSGKEDRHTTESETREMFSVAGKPKELWLIDGASHVDLYHASPEDYKARVIRFLEQHMRTRRL